MASDKFVCPRCGRKRPVEKAAQIVFRHADGSERSVELCEKCCTSVQNKAVKARRRARKAPDVGTSEGTQAPDA